MRCAGEAAKGAVHRDKVAGAGRPTPAQTCASRLRKAALSASACTDGGRQLCRWTSIDRSEKPRPCRSRQALPRTDEGHVPRWAQNRLCAGVASGSTAHSAGGAWCKQTDLKQMLRWRRRGSARSGVFSSAIAGPTAPAPQAAWKMRSGRSSAKHACFATRRTSALG